jgi:cytochrome b involved in lipid metabolism
MMYTYRFTGPADQGILLKNRGNNAKLGSSMAMPQKFYPSNGGSGFADARKIYRTDAMSTNTLKKNETQLLNSKKPSGFPIKQTDSSQHLYMKKAMAIGQSSQYISSKKSNISEQYPLSFRAQDTTSRNRAISYVRAGGCVAPKKKGAIANTFKSGGGSSLTGTGNRQIVAPMVPTYTIAQISQHNSNTDAWIAYDEYVYNITTSAFDMAHIDPQYWGTDITTVITNQHHGSSSAPTTNKLVKSMLQPYIIGLLVK